MKPADKNQGIYRINLKLYTAMVMTTVQDAKMYSVVTHEEAKNLVISVMQSWNLILRTHQSTIKKNLMIKEAIECVSTIAKEVMNNP